ncbi:hypothetical protein [Tropicimonas marinistellae]|uniref:hypothetical protein n=1 Tax=Tropicimonas marinistellae TaxID=1739787 RepID=UPI00082DAF45|nr:hypothetical protein [Tropicimonas marinistellae]
MALGQRYDDFWSLTLRDYEIATRGLRRLRESEIERDRMLNHELATMVHFAIFDPKKMPDPTKKAEKPADPMVTADAARAAMHAFAMAHNQTVAKRPGREKR